MPEYEILKIPMVARNLAASRTPRLQPSVAAEYGDMVSGEVARGDWSIDPQDGEAINSKGQKIADHLEFCLSTRPHWLVPATLADPADDTWTSGSLTKQGARLKQLRAFCGSDQAALVLLTEEAARFGVKPFTTEKGEKLSEKAPQGAKRVSGSNPWGDAYVKANGQEAAYAERARLMRTLNLKACTALAAAAGYTVTGAKLKK
jgi:hypothetical protein